MITGYNHNINYKDKVCHIQTEDSGVEKAHIITHLFVGGNIISSEKVSYSDIAANEDNEAQIVALMQNQHKTMLKSLIRGSLDEQLAIRSANAATLDGPAPLNVEAGGQNRASFGLPGVGATPAAPTPPAAPAAPTPPEPPPIAAQAPAAKPAPVSPPPLAPPTVTTPPPPAAAPPVAAAAPAAPAPAPAGLGGSLSGMGGSSEPSIFDTTGEAGFFGGSDVQSSFFGDAPPPQEIIEAETLQRAFESHDESVIDSIFGEDLISEKSLDEVILSYLAEDMQE